MLAVHLVAAARAGRELSIVSAVFILPFLLFSGYAGQLADIYSKRTVLVVSKSLEIVAATLGLVAFAFGHLQLTYAVLFLIALQATFFSPAKYGILPEMLPDRDLSRANGVLEMSTFVAIVLGTAVGGYLFEALHARLWLIGVLVVGVAVVGTISSFGIPRVPAAAAPQTIDPNPWGEIWTGVKTLRRDRVLWLTVLGISYFWFLGSLLQLVVILFGTETMKLTDTWVAVLTACAAIGIGAGSLIAGRLSGDKVELGLAPIGAIGMGVFAIALSRSGHSFTLAAINLTIVGVFGGFFAVPLNALLQQKSGDAEKGRLMATNSFLNMVGIMLASGALALLSDYLRLTPESILLIFGVLTLISSLYVLSIVPEFLVRFSLWLLTHTVYRIRIVGQENVPSRGPALLVCNHLSHVDGFLVGSCMQRFVRFLVYKPYFEHWAFNRLLTVHEGHSGGIWPRRPGVARTRQAGTAERPRGLYLCGRIDQPDGKHAPAQARIRADCRRTGCAGHSRLPRSRVGQHFQLQGRAFLLEVAGSRAVSGYGGLWSGSAVDHDCCAGAPGAANTQLRPRDGAPAIGRITWTPVRSNSQASVGDVFNGRRHDQTDDVWPHARRVAPAVALGATPAGRRDERRVTPSGIRRRFARERGDIAVGQGPRQPEFHGWP